ncbi:MAG: TadE/TadG family type IV pilus assembly protein [Candidatus Binatia bacterium]
MFAYRKILGCKRGQALIEFGLSLPLLLLLLLGGIEISNMINHYLVLTHLTREGANLTARKTDPATALDAIILGAKPTLCEDGVGCTTNAVQWNVIYSEVAPVNPGGCSPPSASDPDCAYIITDQITRGSLGKSSQIGSEGDPVTSAQIPKIDEISPGQTFQVIEVFYDYGPSTLTPLQNFLNQALPNNFYVRTIFTDVG